MNRKASRLTLLALAPLALGASAAVAAPGDAVSEARLSAAKRQVQTVCRSLETRHAYTRAARCYANVSAYLSDPTVSLFEPRRPRVAQAPVVAPPPPTRIALATPARRGGSLLTSNFVLLGVGY